MMKKLYFILCLTLVQLPLLAQKVWLSYDKASPQAAYAAKKLGETLKELNHHIDKNYDFRINLDMDGQNIEKEAFSIVREGNVVTVHGGDHRGMIYGAFELAEMLQNGTSLEKVTIVKNKPHQEFRGIKFNLPWQTYRPSSALDQHNETVRDLKYWEAFLDMMVENRFNVISLWNMHPYTFMIQPRNFPEASPWSEEEFAKWRHLYKEIFRMAKERGLDTYIVHWNIFVSREFAEAYNVAEENFYPHYYVEGDTSEIVKVISVKA